MRKLLLALLFTGACALPPKPNPAPVPIDRSAEFTATCSFIWQTELGRPIDAAALTDCIRRARAGETGDQIQASVHETAEAVAHRDALAHPPAPTGAGETGLVRRDGLVFRKADGSIFQWRGCTEFLAFKRYLEEPDHGDLTNTLQERIAAGCNTFRVLGMVDSFAKLRPETDGTGLERDYYADLHAFFDYINAFNARVEFVAFADAQIVMPDSAAQERHIEKVYAALAEPRAVEFTNFLEVANEPFKNIPGGGDRAQALGRLVQGRSARVLVASGDYDVPNCATTFHHLDYVTLHNERKPDWPRTARALGEVRDGFGWGADCTTSFGGVGVPVVGDEPMGFAEVESGSRSVSSVDAAYFASTCALMGAGCTFHSTAGVTSSHWGPVQAEAAAAFFEAMKWMPTQTQLSPYMRGGTEPGCHWVGESLVEHDDARELRTFGKVIGNEAWAVQIRTTRAQPTTCGPWQVVDTLRPGILHLTR